MTNSREQLTKIEATAEGVVEHTLTGPDRHYEPTSDNPCDGKRSSAGLVIELRPTTADRLSTAARRAGSTPAAMAEKALEFWLRREEFRAWSRAAHVKARLLVERLRAEGRLNPEPFGQPRKQEGTPR